MVSIIVHNKVTYLSVCNSVVKHDDDDDNNKELRIKYESLC